MPLMNNDIVSLYFLVVALILFLVLVFVYKMMMAIGKLDKRLEQLAHHLRDLNLYEFHPGENGIFGRNRSFARSLVFAASGGPASRCTAIAITAS